MRPRGSKLVALNPRWQTEEDGGEDQCSLDKPRLHRYTAMSESAVQDSDLDVTPIPVTEREIAIAQRKASADDSPNDLVLAANAIFGGTSNEVLLSSGKICQIFPATMKHIPAIINFFTHVLNSLDKDQIGGFIELIVDKQIALIKEGKDPNKISMEDLSGTELVSNIFGNVSILGAIFSSVFDFLPEVIEKFTNLSGEEFSDLPPDEGMLIAGGIFTINYGFFSRSLPPLLTAFMKSWASKNIKVESSSLIKRMAQKRR